MYKYRLTIIIYMHYIREETDGECMKFRVSILFMFLIGMVGWCKS